MSRLLLIILSPFIFALPAQAQPTRSAADVERLVRQLGSESFAQREAASKALDAIGEPALEALQKAAQNRDSEVRKRGAELVKIIEK